MLGVVKRLDPASPAARDLATGRYRIRKMGLADLEAVAIPWMRDAGWNPGLNDATAFLAADPEGFLLGELDGRAVACVSAVRYDDAFGFMGCYIVEAGHRGRGYGMALHEAGRAHLAGCTQGGDGVLENVDLYRRIGRVFAHRNARYQGTRGAAWPRPAAGTVDARDLSHDAFMRFDRACFPAPRPSFLRAWLAQPGAHALAVPGPDGEPLGYGVIRPCFKGWKIGPLFARDPATAEGLFLGLVGRIAPGDPFVLDVPGCNAEAMALVRRHGMTEVFATARMYTGPFPSTRLDWVYGITTFELG